MRSTPFARVRKLCVRKRDRNRTSETRMSARRRARSSGGERHIDTVEVIGSKPIVPTMQSSLRRAFFMRASDGQTENEFRKAIMMDAGAAAGSTARKYCVPYVLAVTACIGARAPRCDRTGRDSWESRRLTESRERRAPSPERGRRSGRNGGSGRQPTMPSWIGSSRSSRSNSTASFACSSRGAGPRPDPNARRVVRRRPGRSRR